ncbi:liver-expressed antimicrobial peptide 2 [Paramormyrops kingsleyae]|uniref:liver-expressed antimicrobial peptide 2 n=1 Tax=Paramormyrops kingsleyae TaxID=1676925 RepID=UPI003B96FB12
MEGGAGESSVELTLDIKRQRDACPPQKHLQAIMSMASRKTSCNKRAAMCSRTGGALGFLLILVIHQVSSSGRSDSAEKPVHRESTWLLRQAVRMTPLWRTLGSKPFGAFCRDSYECSTRICRNSHCGFHQPAMS